MHFRNLKKSCNARKVAPVHPTVKKYVFNDQMQFLNKLYDSRETADSLENTVNSENELTDNEQLYRVSKESRKWRKKYWEICKQKTPQAGWNWIKNVESTGTGNPKSAYVLFQGVIPHLKKIDDSEVLEFQIGVLKVIANIKEKRARTQPRTVPYQPKHWFTHQPPSFPNSQHSCITLIHLLVGEENHFNPSLSYQLNSIFKISVSR